tara:strand:+ start:2563 stop:2994 length:432 start_codon:yes stop_codon:yes gene_type:complete
MDQQVREAPGSVQKTRPKKIVAKCLTLLTGNVYYRNINERRTLMAKFNPGMTYQVVAVPVSRLNNRAMKLATKKFAKFFNIDNDLNEVVNCAEWWGYTMGNSPKFIFIVEDHSEYSKMAIDSPDLWDLALESDPEQNTVKIIK